jgi:hypothetical protein
LLWSALWVEISTLAYATNSFLTRKFVSGILYPYNSDKSNAQKLEISTKLNVYRTEGPTDMLLVVLG